MTKMNNSPCYTITGPGILIVDSNKLAKTEQFKRQLEAAKKLNLSNNINNEKKNNDRT